MHKQYEWLVDTKTSKTLKNCHVIWSSESDIGGNLVLYSYNTPVCEISINSQFIKFMDKWNYSKTTIKQVKIFIYNYTGRVVGDSGYGGGVGCGGLCLRKRRH